MIEKSRFVEASIKEEKHDLKSTDVIKGIIRTSWKFNKLSN